MVITYNQIIKELNDFADAHKQIETFGNVQNATSYLTLTILCYGLQINQRQWAMVLLPGTFKY